MLYKKRRNERKHAQRQSFVPPHNPTPLAYLISHARQLFRKTETMKEQIQFIKLEIPTAILRYPPQAHKFQRTLERVYKQLFFLICFLFVSFVLQPVCSSLLAIKKEKMKENT